MKCLWWDKQGFICLIHSLHYKMIHEAQLRYLYKPNVTLVFKKSFKSTESKLSVWHNCIFDSYANSSSVTLRTNALKCEQTLEKKGLFGAIFICTIKRGYDPRVTGGFEGNIPSELQSIELKWSPTTKWSVKAFQHEMKVRRRPEMCYEDCHHPNTRM